MNRADRQALAARVANAAVRRLPPRLTEIRAAVWADAERAAKDGFGEDAPDAPDAPGHAHEPAWVPALSAIACVRRLPGGGRCPVRFRAYLPGPEATPSTTGRHEWPPFDEADVAPERAEPLVATAAPVELPAAPGYGDGFGAGFGFGGGDGFGDGFGGGYGDGGGYGGEVVKVGVEI